MKVMILIHEENVQMHFKNQDKLKYNNMKLYLFGADIHYTNNYYH